MKDDCKYCVFYGDNDDANVILDINVSYSDGFTEIRPPFSYRAPFGCSDVNDAINVSGPVTGVAVIAVLIIICVTMAIVGTVLHFKKKRDQRKKREMLRGIGLKK